MKKILAMPTGRNLVICHNIASFAFITLLLVRSDTELQLQTHLENRQ